MASSAGFDLVALPDRPAVADAATSVSTSESASVPTAAPASVSPSVSTPATTSTPIPVIDLPVPPELTLDCNAVPSETPSAASRALSNWIILDNIFEHIFREWYPGFWTCPLASPVTSPGALLSAIPVDVPSSPGTLPTTTLATTRLHSDCKQCSFDDRYSALARCCLVNRAFNSWATPKLWREPHHHKDFSDDYLTDRFAWIPDPARRQQLANYVEDGVLASCKPTSPMVDCIESLKFPRLRKMQLGLCEGGEWESYIPRIRAPRVNYLLLDMGQHERRRGWWFDEAAGLDLMMEQVVELFPNVRNISVRDFWPEWPEQVDWLRPWMSRFVRLEKHNF
jgi:hypothetical protein